MMSFQWNSFNGMLACAVYFAGGLLASEAIRRISALFKKREIQRARCEAIFFPDKEIPCKHFFDNVEGCRRNPCSFSHEVTGFRYSIGAEGINVKLKFITSLIHCFRKLIDCIKSARKSIDICVYCISCYEIVDYVLQRHKVGVRVRVITDLTMDEAAGSQNHRFMKHGNTYANSLTELIYFILICQGSKFIPISLHF